MPREGKTALHSRWSYRAWRPRSRLPAPATAHCWIRPQPTPRQARLLGSYRAGCVAPRASAPFAWSSDYGGAYRAARLLSPVDSCHHACRGTNHSVRPLLASDHPAPRASSGDAHQTHRRFANARPEVIRELLQLLDARHLPAPPTTGCCSPGHGSRPCRAISTAQTRSRQRALRADRTGEHAPRCRHTGWTAAANDVYERTSAARFCAISELSRSQPACTH